ncbi:MAG: ABC transporter ATP-binding protein [Gemmatimonadota bacterium]
MLRLERVAHQGAPQPGSAEPVVRVRGVTKRFGARTVLSQLDATFPAGRITGLVGPNAAGKTTLIKILLGLVTADAGQVEVFGRPLDGTPGYRARLGYMPQAARFAEHLTGRELVAMVRDLRGATGPVDDALLDSLAGTAALDQQVATLSGGTRQKLNAALAFLFRPDLLILDEPTAGLDPVASRRLKDHIIGAKERGVSVVLSSHLAGELEELADHLVFVLDGRTRFEGPPRELARTTGHADLERGLAALMTQATP